MIPLTDEERYPPDVRGTGLLQRALGIAKMGEEMIFLFVLR